MDNQKLSELVIGHQFKSNSIYDFCVKIDGKKQPCSKVEIKFDAMSTVGYVTLEHAVSLSPLQLETSTYLFSHYVIEDGNIAFYNVKD